MGFSLFDWVSGAGKVQEKAVDAVIKTGDALFFTDEEKSVANQKILDWRLDYAKATSSQSVARRFLAVTLSLTYVFILLVACAAGYFDRGQDSYAQWLFDVLADILQNPINIIVGFYFVTGTMRAFTGNSK